MCDSGLPLDWCNGLKRWIQIFGVVVQELIAKKSETTFSELKRRAIPSVYLKCVFDHGVTHKLLGKR